MRINRPLILAGVIIALATTAAIAAERAPVHTMTVSLPDGSVERIRYTGDVAPRVLVGDASTGAPTSSKSMFDTAFGPDPPFAEMDRIAAEMNRQSAAMMRQVAASGQTPGAGGASLDPVALQKTLADAPAGATSYQMVSTSNGGAMCSQSVEVTSMGAGKAPQVVRKVSDGCGADAKAAPTATPAVTHPDVAPSKRAADTI